MQDTAKDPTIAPIAVQKSATKVENATLKATGLTNREVENWQNLRSRYLTRKPFDFDKASPPEASFFIDYDDLPSADAAEISKLLNKIVYVKLNGGLGTSMGCKGPKSSIEVVPGMTFLDLTVTNVQHLNKKYGVDIPLVLMNSYKTDAETKKIITKYEHSKVSITTCQQSKLPAFYKDTLTPVAKPNAPLNDKDWYPPGSGDVFATLHISGMLDKFIADGKEYIFMSNVENLGGIVDFKILKSVVSGNKEFCLEVTDRISTDVTGGVLAKLGDKVHVLETSQVPSNKADHFKPLNYRYWNTNNMWVHTSNLLTLLQKNSLELDFVVKTTGNILHIETPAGMAIQSFANPVAIHVPRIRYRPVKSTSQLMGVQSNIFDYSQGFMEMNPKREPATMPLIKLGEHFSEVPAYASRFKGMPNLLELEHLTVSGDVWFGSGVTLKGTVIIVANHGERIDIPDGVVLENKIISGNIRILDH